jgi:tetratricopeptide (TPR) repeat protein
MHVATRTAVPLLTILLAASVSRSETVIVTTRETTLRSGYTEVATVIQGDVLDVSQERRHDGEWWALATTVDGAKGWLSKKAIVYAAENEDWVRFAILDRFDPESAMFGKNNVNMFEQPRVVTATRLASELVDQCVRRLGSSDPRTVDARYALGRLQIQLGQLESARTSLAKVLADCVQIHGPNNWRTCQTQVALVETFRRLGDYRHARRFAWLAEQRFFQSTPGRSRTTVPTQSFFQNWAMNHQETLHGLKQDKTLQRLFGTKRSEKAQKELPESLAALEGRLGVSPTPSQKEAALLALTRPAEVDDAEYWFALGLSLVELGHENEGTDLCRRAFELRSEAKSDLVLERADAAFQMGKLYLLRGHRRRSREQLDRALAILREPPQLRRGFQTPVLRVLTQLGTAGFDARSFSAVVTRSEVGRHGGCVGPPRSAQRV